MSTLHFYKKLSVGQWVFMPVFVVFLMVFLCCCAHNNTNKTLDAAHRFLWIDLDSCGRILRSIDVASLDSVQAKRYRLYQTHQSFRSHVPIDNYDELLSLADAFVRAKDYLHAGEAYHIVGSSYSNQENGTLATQYLKEAEYYLNLPRKKDENLLGITYYKLGKVAEQEKLYHIAKDYFQEALVHLRQTDNELFTCCAYRGVACSLPNDQTDLSLIWLDSARIYAQRLENPSFLMEIECIIVEVKQQAGESQDKPIGEYKILCDSMQHLPMSADLVKYYLSVGELDSAKHYLDILHKDTVHRRWSTEQYLYLSALYQTSLGHQDSALLILQALQQWQAEDIMQTTQVQTYAISQQYDWEKQEERLKADEKEKAILRWSIALVLGLAAVGCVTTYLLYKRRSTLHRQERDKRMAEFARLANNNMEKKMALQQALVDELKEMRQQNIDKHLRSRNNTRQLSEICEKFDVIHDHFLQRQKEAHPSITPKDQCLMVCMLLGFSIEDCCILLNMTKSTVYNRRKRIRQHLELPADMSLEDWIAQQKG